MPSALRKNRRSLPSLAMGVTLILALAASGCAHSNRSKEMTPQHHAIDYIEFTVVDLAEAKRFYGTAFGWTFQDYGPDYVGIQRTGGEGEVGGMRRDAKVEHGGPLVVLYSDDLEASVRAVGDAGGRIVKEPFAFPGGRRFHFEDPSGNELAVYSVE